MKATVLTAILLTTLAGAQPASAKTHAIRIYNDAPEPTYYADIIEVNMKCTSCNEWGDNLLGAPISVGESSILTVKNPLACSYMIRASYRDGETVIEQTVDICSQRELHLK